MRALSVSDLQALRAQVLTRLAEINERLTGLGAPPDAVLAVDRLTMGRLIGIAANTVSIYAREGMPVLSAGRNGKAGSYDAVAALAWWRVKKQGSADAEKARKDRSQSELNELRLAMQRGQVLPREDVERDAEACARTTRDAFSGLARRMVLLGIIPASRQPEVENLFDEALDAVRAWAESVPHSTPPRPPRAA